MDLLIEATISVSIDDPFIGDSFIDEWGKDREEYRVWRVTNWPGGCCGAPTHLGNPTTPLSSSAARGK